MAWSDSQILDAIAHYYGTNSSLWDKITTNNATFEEIQTAYNAIPQVSTVRSIDGTALGLDYNVRFAEPPSIVTEIVSGSDSNYGTPEYGNNGYLTGNVPANVGGGGGGDYTFSSGAISGSGSATSTLATVADKLSLAVTGVNVGAKLGMKIDELLYNTNPDWWNEHFPTINPQTWSSIAGSNDLGANFIRVLFGIKDGVMTPYVTDDVIAYVYQLLRDTGALDEGESDIIDIGIANLHNNVTTYNLPVPYYKSTYIQSGTTITPVFTDNSNADIFLVQLNNFNRNIIGVCDTSFTLTIGNTSYTSSQVTTAGDHICHVVNRSLPMSQVYADNFHTITITPTNINVAPDLYELITYGITQEITPVPGIQPMPNAPYGTPSPDIITGNDIPTIKQQLKQNYPDLFQNPITNTVPQDDGTLTTYEYYPIPWPNNTTQTTEQPITGNATQTGLTISPETIPELFPETETESDTPIVPPPSTGTGDTPPIIVPTVTPDTLWAIYNPTSTQINNFGSWLWSSNFIDQILKLFANPMQAIISLHKIYCTPDTGNTQNIIVGYLDSGVSSKIVTNQYKSFSCGKINLREYFGNVFDYSPFTKIHVYLPFIGICPVEVSDLMRGEIEVIYSVDVYTGACTAKLNVIRDGYGGTIYEWSGNAAVFYPVSSGDYTGIIRGIISAAGGITAGIATANPLSIAGGIIGGAMQSHFNVQHSGSFSGNAGAMNLRKPYLIISRPQTKMPNDFNKFYGYPSNSKITLNQCDGYIKIKSQHIKIPNATQTELNEIEKYLVEGVII